MMASDKEIVTRAQNGDDDAFAEIVHAYLPITYTFLVRYLNDPAIAEDATQETFVKAWRALKRFDADRALKPWLLRIARNTANDKLRKRRALPFSWLSRKDDGGEIDMEDTLQDDAPLPDELFERKESAEILEKALAKLPERDRAVLLLRYADGLSFDEIGMALNTPLNTAKSWHHRALGRLRRLISPPPPSL
jgi:RNA polymerase sigma-70 factor, ECF subfamily